MSVEYISTQRFDAEILNADNLVLVDFFATWCGPCQMMAPIIEEIAEESDGSYDVYKCDIDENEELALEYSVMSVPTMIIFKDGEEVDRFIGVSSKHSILNALKSCMD